VAICDPRDFISTNLNLLALGMIMLNMVIFGAAVLEKKIF